MRTTVELNDDLVLQTMQLSRIESTEELLKTALYEFLRKLKKRELASLRGAIEWEGDLNQMRTSPNE
jgi:Arc/MetJ family transcription regulator